VTSAFVDVVLMVLRMLEVLAQLGSLLLDHCAFPKL
jgi:hypothetical protein